MRIRELFKEDDAVSPVIGVILMVAITVILAAVIASFVLGLGDQADEVQPTTNFEFDYNGTALEVTATSGDEIDPANLYIRGSNVTEAADSPGGTSNTGSIDPGSSVRDEIDGSDSFVTPVGDLSDDEINSGEGFVITFSDSASPADGFEIDIVWETADDSATLASDEGPDA